MDEYKLIVNQKANDSINEIYRYISHNLHDTYAARRTVNRITKAISKLNYAPNRGRLIGKGNWGDEIRIIGAKNFVIQFAVGDTKRIVYILDVIYGHRNII